MLWATGSSLVYELLALVWSSSLCRATYYEWFARFHPLCRATYLYLECFAPYRLPCFASWILFTLECHMVVTSVIPNSLGRAWINTPKHVSSQGVLSFQDEVCLRYTGWIVQWWYVGWCSLTQPAKFSLPGSQNMRKCPWWMRSRTQ